jgi:hypothetical protein
VQAAIAMAATMTPASITSASRSLKHAADPASSGAVLRGVERHDAPVYVHLLAIADDADFALVVVVEVDAVVLRFHAAHAEKAAAAAAGGLEGVGLIGHARIVSHRGRAGRGYTRRGQPL